MMHKLRLGKRSIRLANLAELHLIQRRYAEAERLMERAMVIVSAAVGQDLPIFVTSSDGLARLARITKLTDLNLRNLGRESINSEWLADVRFGAHSGLKSDIAPCPKSARAQKATSLRPTFQLKDQELRPLWAPSFMSARSRKTISPARLPSLAILLSACRTFSRSSG
jgi:hypothetical protein